MTSQQSNPRVFSVTEITQAIQGLLEENFDFVWVEGEISNFGAPSSGHYYMNLKDEKAVIRAVMFRPQARYLKFIPENGMKVIAQGRIGVYVPRGEYQIILDYLEPMGVGALALAYEQLKTKLASQGFFDEEIKKPLPFLPARVALITSPTGAAVKDFLKVIHRRFANIEISIIPVRVQGEGASEDIVEAIEIANKIINPDVIVITRGGGSLEDLWAFNQEKTALAIRRSRIPIVSAVGHEIDITISDLTADFRAPTPSAAAELLAVEKEALVRHLADLKSRMKVGMKSIIRRDRQSLHRVSRLLRDPGRRLAENWMRLDDTNGRLLKGIRGIIRDRHAALKVARLTLDLHAPDQLIKTGRQQLGSLVKSMKNALERSMAEVRASISTTEKRLLSLSPLAVLKRGYSITRELPGHEIMRKASPERIGKRVQVLLGEGELECIIQEAYPERRS